MPFRAVEALRMQYDAIKQVEAALDDGSMTREQADAWLAEVKRQTATVLAGKTPWDIWLEERGD